MTLDVFACQYRDEPFDPGMLRQDGDLPLVEDSYDIYGCLAALCKCDQSRFDRRVGRFLGPRPSHGGMVGHGSTIHP